MFPKSSEMSLVARLWEKLKNRELGPLGESKSNNIADLFIMFIIWTSQKASKVH